MRTTRLAAFSLILAALAAPGRGEGWKPQIEALLEKLSQPGLAPTEGQRMQGELAGMLFRAYQQGDCEAVTLATWRFHANLKACAARPSCWQSLTADAERFLIMAQMSARHAACQAQLGESDAAERTLSGLLEVARRHPQPAVVAHELATTVLEGEGGAGPSRRTLLRRVALDLGRGAEDDPAQLAARQRVGLLCGMASRLYRERPAQEDLLQRALAGADRVVARLGVPDAAARRQAAKATQLMPLTYLTEMHLARRDVDAAHPYARRMKEAAEGIEWGAITHPASLPYHDILKRHPEVFLTADERARQREAMRESSRSLRKLLQKTPAEASAQPAPEPPAPRATTLEERLEAMRRRVKSRAQEGR